MSRSKSSQGKQGEAPRPARKKVARRSGRRPAKGGDTQKPPEEASSKAPSRQQSGPSDDTGKRSRGRARQGAGKGDPSHDKGKQHPRGRSRTTTGEDAGKPAEPRKGDRKEDAQQPAAEHPADSGPQTAKETRSHTHDPRQAGKSQSQGSDTTAEWHAKAWEIFRAEVSEEGGTMVNDQDIKELARRAFAIARLFLEERERNRRF